ncbi:hypothetical protein FNV43_RR21746 [Rhamnella rubrinervis]|uniref:Uncharacterized protein n=1 Tax=Rhamnella rubrinervis TaxID=2594499 RepID=A0A8K0DQ89_9ROSA|nr:hypothetical protein FNV43_RR21746 [Rhamnella rubrinervis]
MSFQSDIVAKLYQAEVDIESPTRIPCQRPKKEVAAQEELSRRQSTYASASTSGDKYKKIKESENAQRRELDRKKKEVGQYLSKDTIVVPQSYDRVQYVDAWQLEQFEIDHSYTMYHWYMDQHRNDPSEQEALNAYLEHIRVEIQRVPEIAAVEENPEEEEDPEGYSKDE